MNADYQTLAQQAKPYLDHIATTGCQVGVTLYNTPINIAEYYRTLSRDYPIATAIIDGKPAAIFGDGGTPDTQYICASDTNGLSWKNRITIYDYCEYWSMAEVGGVPAISAVATNRLHFMRADSLAASNWTDTVVSTVTNDVEYTSLLVVQGNPCIAYKDDTEKALYFVRANDSIGSSWLPPVAVDTDYEAGTTPTLLNVDGNPAIGYVNSSSQAVCYVRADNAWGTAWGTPLYLDTTNQTTYANMMSPGGCCPRIFYNSARTGGLWIVAANDMTGAVWSDPEYAVSNSSTIGFIDSDTYIGTSFYGVSYIDYTEKALKFASSIAMIEWPSVIIEDYSQYSWIENTPALQIVNDQPAIFSYGNQITYLRNGNIPTNTYLNWIAIEP